MSNTTIQTYKTYVNGGYYTINTALQYGIVEAFDDLFLQTINSL
jgi:hypothetical protein